MPYLDQTALKAMGFASLGRGVRISDKAVIDRAGELRIGDHSRIDDFCMISGKVEIGRNVHIAPFCIVAGGAAGVRFEDFSGLAYRVSIFAQPDGYDGAASEAAAPVRLGRHVIVGAGAVIGPGVTLAEGTSVGAQSLVVRSTEPWTIYAGSPARKLKDRRHDLLDLERQYLASEGT